MIIIVGSVKCPPFCQTALDGPLRPVRDPVNGFPPALMMFPNSVDVSISISAAAIFIPSPLFYIMINQRVITTYLTQCDCVRVATVTNDSSKLEPIIEPLPTKCSGYSKY
jgi:hypothetical protein